MKGQQQMFSLQDCHDRVCTSLKTLLGGLWFDCRGRCGCLWGCLCQWVFVLTGLLRLPLVITSWYQERMVRGTTSYLHIFELVQRQNFAELSSNYLAPRGQNHAAVKKTQTNKTKNKPTALNSLPTSKTTTPWYC